MEKRKKKNDRFSKPSPELIKDSKPDAGKSGPPAFLRFSGIAFEMVATIGVATYIGYLLDDYLKLRFPAFLLSFAMLSLAGSLYLLYKRLPKD